MAVIPLPSPASSSSLSFFFLALLLLFVFLLLSPSLSLSLILRMSKNALVELEDESYKHRGVSLQHGAGTNRFVLLSLGWMLVCFCLTPIPFFERFVERLVLRALLRLNVLDLSRGAEELSMLARVMKPESRCKQDF